MICQNSGFDFDFPDFCFRGSTKQGGGTQWTTFFLLTFFKPSHARDRLDILRTHAAAWTSFARTRPPEHPGWDMRWYDNSDRK